MDETLPFHTYLWKIASRCNLNCTYCYVYNSQDSGWKRQPRFMSEAVARQAALRILEHCREHDKSEISITFHGGEPLLGGVSHLDMLTSVIRTTLQDNGVDVHLGMQSNGLLFTPDIGDLMLERGIRFGVSIDGPPEVNDKFRVDHRGRGTSHLLEEKLRLIFSPKYRSLFSGFLCVIDPDSDPVEVTRYLLSYEFPVTDFLLPENNHTHRPPRKESDVTSTPYGDWMIKAFDYWFLHARRGKIRTFTSIMSMLLGGPSEVEALGTAPVDLVVIETNGDVEGVDTLKSTFEGGARLGYNVFTHDLTAVARASAIRHRQIGLRALSPICQSCPIVGVCGGGYLPHRYSAENGFNNPSVYCSDLMKLIHHIGVTTYKNLQQEPALVAAARG